MKLSKYKDYLFLHGVLLVYVVCMFLEKYNGRFEFLSPDFIFFYIIVVGVLGIYALLWQQALKRIDLNVAYANKSATVIWGIILGALIFQEPITIATIIEAVLVFIGIILVVPNE
ncbi:MAG: EamA family transporter [archaeon]|nr:EamA family transporter [archaeon]